MKTFTAISNSTIYDVCLNTYGTLDHLVKLMDDNGHEGVDVDPVNGQVFQYDESFVNNISVNNTGSPAAVGSTLLSVKYATQDA